MAREQVNCFHKHSHGQILVLGYKSGHYIIIIEFNKIHPKPHFTLNITIFSKKCKRKCAKVLT